MRCTFVRFATLPAALALLVALWVMPALADPRDFSVVNDSSITLAQVFVGPSDSADWGNDIMGRDVLSSGETVNISFSRFDGETCLYDVKVVGSAGEIGVMYKVDLCSVTTVSFHD